VVSVASSLAAPEAAASLNGSGVPDPVEPLPLLLPLTPVLPLPLLPRSPLLLPLTVPPEIDAADDPSPFGSSPGSAAHAPATTTNGARTTSGREKRRNTIPLNSCSDWASRLGFRNMSRGRHDVRLP